MKPLLAFVLGSIVSGVVMLNLPDHDELKEGDCFSLLGLGLGRVTKVNKNTYEYRVKYHPNRGWSLPDRNTKDSSIFGPRVDCITYE